MDKSNLLKEVLVVSNIIPGVQIAKEKKQQELVAKIVFPIFLVGQKVCRKLYCLMRLEGVIYGLNRARLRAKLGALGEYSDVCSDVVIRSPQNLYIGRRSSIGYGGFVDAGGGITIGDYVMISHMVSINSMSHPTTPPYHSVIKAETKIHSHAWIGAGSIIKEGVEIGEGAIVGAGAVVTKSVPPWTMVAGVPAKYVRDIPNGVNN